jgi:hypothetical protein
MASMIIIYPFKPFLHSLLIEVDDYWLHDKLHSTEHQQLLTEGANQREGAELTNTVIN